mmetsp:Transcript_49564/g.97171  ORF Transcript_49564/g.97171 Transcript_49564/m.97171 type:complete len:244 (+) Transcript_49564:387-1118(+)
MPLCLSEELHVTLSFMSQANLTSKSHARFHLEQPFSALSFLYRMRVRFPNHSSTSATPSASQAPPLLRVLWLAQTALQGSTLTLLGRYSANPATSVLCLPSAVPASATCAPKAHTVTHLVKVNAIFARQVNSVLRWDKLFALLVDPAPMLPEVASQLVILVLPGNSRMFKAVKRARAAPWVDTLTLLARCLVPFANPALLLVLLTAPAAHCVHLVLSQEVQGCLAVLLAQRGSKQNSPEWVRA